MNRMGTYLIDPRDQALGKASSRSIRETDPYHDKAVEWRRPGLTFRGDKK
jgi:hypothetical protein